MGIMKDGVWQEAEAKEHYERIWNKDEAMVDKWFNDTKKCFEICKNN